MLLSFLFSKLVLRPKNWHPIRQRTLTCVWWELINYFGELQHDMKTVFGLTELRLDGVSVWWFTAVSSVLFWPAFHTRSCHFFGWHAASDWALSGRRAPQQPKFFAGKKVLATQRSEVLPQSLTWPINIFDLDYSPFIFKGADQYNAGILMFLLQNHQLGESSSSNAVARSSAGELTSSRTSILFLTLAVTLTLLLQDVQLL